MLRPNRRCFDLTRDSWCWLLVGCVTLSLGCSATRASRFRAADGAKSIASVGDQSLATTVGVSGSQVTTDTVIPEPYRNPKATISGRVVDAQGRSISGAVVRLADGASKAGRDVQSTTDLSGAFTLGGLRPGSGYLLVAEADFGDEQGVITGRAEANTSETGVQIRLGDSSEAVPTPAPRRTTAKSPRTRQVADRVDADVKPASPSSANLEDIEPPALDAAEVEAPAVSGGQAKSGAKANQASAEDSDPSSGWRRPGLAPEPKRARAVTPPAAASDGEEEPLELDPGAKATRRPSSQPDETNDDNPLPLAIPRSRATGGATPPSARSVSQNQPRSRTKATPELESAVPGELALGHESAPETADSLAEPVEPAATGLPPMPLVASLDGPSDAPRRLPLAGGSGPTEPPPPEPLDPEQPSLATATNPAPLASGEVVSTSAESGPPATGADYNPFALVPAIPLEPLKPASVAAPAPSETPASRSADLSEVATTSAPVGEAEAATASQPRKWGELVQAAPIAGAAALGVAAGSARSPVDLTRTTATPAVTSNRPGAFFMKRTRAAAPAKADAVATSEFNTRANQLIDFQLPDLAGQPVRFRDFDADFVILDFWGTWCGECVGSIPQLVELQKKYGPTKLKVVGIACERAAVDKRKALVSAAVERLGINYPVLIASLDGTDPVQRDLQVRFYPTMVLLNRQGKVLFRAEGGTESNLFRLDRALAAASRPTQTARR